MFGQKQAYQNSAKAPLQRFGGTTKTPLLGKNILKQPSSAFFAQFEKPAFRTQPLIRPAVKPQNNKAFLGLQKTLKRSLDVAVSGTALLLLAPVFVTLMVLLKREAPARTIFYGGKRLGRGGQAFRCWKFQTMSPGADHILEAYLENNPSEKAYWEQYKKLQNDPRVVGKVARFIRKSSLDELPQLWNVLIGDMSLVGPRPILANEVTPYGRSIAQYYSVTPGITGLWQVMGRNNVTFARRVVMETWYVKNWSLWLDIGLLFKTVPALLNRSGAY